MASLCLDPILFACPSLAKNAGDFDSCVQNILGLHEELININWAEIYTTDKTMDALFSANAYPVCQNIKTVICQFGITYAQPQDIFRVIMALIKKSQFIEKRLGIRDVLITQNKSSPTDHLAGRHPAFVENYNHLLVMMHLDCFFLKTEEKEQVLITKNLCNDPEQIKISGEIGVFDFEDNTRTVQVPHKVTGIFKACGSIKQLLSVLNPVSLWMRSLSDDGRNKAIEIWLFQKYNTTGNGWKFGRNFLPSAIKLGFCNEEGKVKSYLDLVRKLF
jgi:hypothetical protein